MSTDEAAEAAVTAYLDSLPAEARERVEQVRATVHGVVPDLGEKISYGILTFTVGGRTAFHTGGYAGHTGLYPVPDDDALAGRAAAWVAGKGTLKFPHTEELPTGLVEDIARWFADEARCKGARGR